MDGPAATEPRSTQHRWAHVAWAVATPVLAALIALLPASGVTAILGSIYFDGAGDDGEGGGLGLLLIWIAAWVVLFVIASGAVGAWVARRRLSPGSWLVLAAMFASWVPVSVLLGGVAAWFGYRSGLELLGVALAAVLAGALVASTALLADRRLLRALWLLVGVSAVAFVAAVLLVEPSHRRSIYADAPPPMGLVDEELLADRLPGWTVEGYEDAPRDAGWPYARAIVHTADGVELELSFKPGGRSCSIPTGSCTLLPALDDGAAVTLWSDSAMCGTPRQSTYVSVSAQRQEGRWSVDSKRRCVDPPKPSPEELRALLSVVRPVSVDDWVAST